MIRRESHYIDLQQKPEEDFGFSFTDEKELVKISEENKALIDQVVDMKKRLRDIKNIFLPLLNNLNKEPDKELIRWPNRKSVLDEQIRSLERLTEIPS